MLLSSILRKSGFGATSRCQTFTSSGTWTKPDNVSAVSVILVGSGAGGRGGSVGSGGGGAGNYGAGGGGGGGYGYGGGGGGGYGGGGGGGYGGMEGGGGGMTIATSIEATGDLSVNIGAGGAGTTTGSSIGSLGSSSYISGKLEAWGGGRLTTTTGANFSVGAAAGYITTTDGDITSRIQFFYPGGAGSISSSTDPKSIGGGGTGFSCITGEPFGQSTIGLSGAPGGAVGQPGGATVAAAGVAAGWGGNGGRGICLIFWTE